MLGFFYFFFLFFIYRCSRVGILRVIQIITMTNEFFRETHAKIKYTSYFNKCSVAIKFPPKLDMTKNNGGKLTVSLTTHHHKMFISTCYLIVFRTLHDTDKDSWNRDGRFGSKVGQIGPQIGQSRDFFRSDFSTFGSSSQVYWNLIWKSPGFVQFGVQSDPLWSQTYHPSTTVLGDRIL